MTVLFVKRFFKFTALMCIFGLFIVFFWWRLFSPNPHSQQAEQAIEALPPPKPLPANKPVVIKDAAFSNGTVSGGAYIRIPAIALKFPIVEGTTDKILHSGIGHYTHTSTPDNYGNFALAGHDCCRSNGEPFRYLYKLKFGDRVFVETDKAQYEYVITPMKQCEENNKPSAIVNYKDVKVIFPEPCTTENTRSMRKLITLTTCTPYGKEWTPDRLVVWGELTNVRVR